MTGQLGLFAEPAPPTEPAPAPKPIDPWGWRVDYLETDWEDGLRAWMCERWGLALHIEQDEEASPPCAWCVRRGAETLAEGRALTVRGARDAAQKAAEMVRASAR